MTLYKKRILFAPPISHRSTDHYDGSFLCQLGTLKWPLQLSRGCHYREIKIGMNVRTDVLRQRKVVIEERWLPGGGGEYSLIWDIQVCAAPKGRVFEPFLIIKRVLLSADFGHFGHKEGIIFVL